MGSRGPQPIDINWDEFDKLVSFQCTQIEVAAFFGISHDWLDKLCQRHRGEKLSEVWDKRKALGRVRLRKAQFGIVERGGPGAATMAIWLDKKMFPDENPDRQPPPAPGPGSAVKVKATFTEFCVLAGYYAPYPKQEEMRAFILDEIDPRMLLGARGIGKTDYGTVLGIAYDIYEEWFDGTFSTTLILTKSKSRNAAIVEEIAKALKANGVPLEKENTSCVRVKGLIGKDHSVEAITIRSSMRGRHPDRIVMDDPVTDEDVSEAMRTLVKRKYNEALKLTSNVCVIGQPAHQRDLYAELRGLEKMKRLELPYGSIPELDHDLEAQRLAGVDENTIQASYFLKIVTDGTTFFSDIKYIDQMPTGPSVAFIDPSDGGDYTAITVFRGFGDGIAVQGYVWKKAWYHCLDEIMAVCTTLSVVKLCFETNMTGTQPISQLRDLVKKLGLGIGVMGRHSDSNKHAIIQAAGSYSQRIHLSRKSDKTYADHVVNYEYGAKYDDAPDSLARGLEWIGFLKGKK